MVLCLFKNFLSCLRGAGLLTLVIVGSLFAFQPFCVVGAVQGSFHLDVRVVYRDRPLVNVSVVLYRMEDGGSRYVVVAEGVTDSGGVVIFGGLYSGYYCVDVGYRLEGGVFLVIGSESVGYLDSNMSVVVDYIVPLNSLDVRVLSSSGVPLANASVSVYGSTSQGTARFASGVVGSNGSIVFHDLPSYVWVSGATEEVYYSVEVYYNGSIVGRRELRLNSRDRVLYIFTSVYVESAVNVTVSEGSLVIDGAVSIVNCTWYQNGTITLVGNGRLLLENATLIVLGSAQFPGSRSSSLSDFKVRVADNASLLIRGSRVECDDDEFFFSGRIIVEDMSRVNVSDSCVRPVFWVADSPRMYFVDSVIEGFEVAQYWTPAGEVVFVPSSGRIRLVNSTVLRLIPCDERSSQVVEVFSSSVAIRLEGVSGVLSLSSGMHTFWNVFVNSTSAVSYNLTLFETVVRGWKVVSSYDLTLVNSSVEGAVLSSAVVHILDSSVGALRLNNCTAKIANSTFYSLKGTDGNVEISNSRLDGGRLELVGSSPVVGVRGEGSEGGFINVSIRDSVFDGYFYFERGNLSVFRLDAEGEFAVGGLARAFISESSVSRFTANSAWVYLSDVMVLDVLTVVDNATVYLINSSAGRVVSERGGIVGFGWHLLVTVSKDYAYVANATVRAYFLDNGSLAAEGITDSSGRAVLDLLERVTRTWGMRPDLTVNTYYVGNYTLNVTYVEAGELAVKQLLVEIDGNKNISVSLSPELFLTLRTSSSTSYTGFRVDLGGRLYFANGSGLQGAEVILEYRIKGGGVWEPITIVDTDVNGSYLAQWMPTASGSYVVRAKTVFGEVVISKSVDLVVLPFYESYVFTVVSNSTVSALAFNSTSMVLSFTVSGPDGTLGYVNVTIARSLIENITGLRVYLDGSELNYSVYLADDSWLLHFTYRHSTHRVVIDLPEVLIEGVVIDGVLVDSGVVEITAVVRRIKAVMGVEYAVDHVSSAVNVQSPEDGEWGALEETVKIVINGSNFGDGLHKVYIRAYNSSGPGRWFIIKIYVRSLRSRYNLIALMLHPLVSINASTLCRALWPSVTLVARWNPETQSFEGYIPGFSGPEDDFPIEFGYGYFVYLVSPRKLVEVGD